MLKICTPSKLGCKPGGECSFWKIRNLRRERQKVQRCQVPSFYLEFQLKQKSKGFQGEMTPGKQLALIEYLMCLCGKWCLKEFLPSFLPPFTFLMGPQRWGPPERVAHVARTMRRYYWRGWSLKIKSVHTRAMATTTLQSSHQTRTPLKSLLPLHPHALPSTPTLPSCASLSPRGQWGSCQEINSPQSQDIDAPRKAENSPWS